MKLRAVPLQHVLDDGKTESRAAALARARVVDAIETLGEPRDVLGGNADAGVLHAHRRTVLLQEPAYRDRAVLRRVAHGIDDQVGKRAVDLGGDTAQARRRLDAQRAVLRALAPRHRPGPAAR